MSCAGLTSKFVLHFYVFLCDPARFEIGGGSLVGPSSRDAKGAGLEPVRIGEHMYDALYHSRSVFARIDRERWRFYAHPPEPVLRTVAAKT